MSSNSNVNIDNTETIIHSVGEVSVMHVNYIKPCLELLELLFTKYAHYSLSDSLGEEKEYISRQIDDVLNITKDLLASPIKKE